MTSLEKDIARALSCCTFLPGSFDKKFVKQLPNWQKRDMTEKGKTKMISLLHKYRRQIPNYSTLTGRLNKQTEIQLNPIKITW